MLENLHMPELVIWEQLEMKELQVSELPIHSSEANEVGVSSQAMFLGGCYECVLESPGSA